ncbi:tyrosine-type recombinase/integrase [Thermanaeromonas sp. C210]|uniref:tyrosine-type recombinase/integrase n=1 Tax=Thermanaeromonas sp. C210 TaxID=2731925 RepID=UPI00155C19A8|nr:tyrosine-type recombinase/integrase [Thermanaeromonas sp. C210]GFN24284.1 hypothetical protein TAMC210_26020 [Thermanaeromonas sp. C210]
MKVLRIDGVREVKWQEALQQFLWKKSATGISERTLKDYRKIVSLFFGRFPEAWPKALKPAVYEFMADDIKPATYNLRLIYLRAFFNFCLEEGYIEENPLAGFKRKKTDIRFVNLDYEHLEKLLSLPNRKTFAGLRDYALLLLTLDTGIRPSEALSLMPEDVNLKALTVTVSAETAKTRVARTLPLSPATADAIRKLLAVRPPLWKNAPLFCSQDGRKMLETSWWHRVNKYCQKLGIKLRAYDLRHIAATEFLRGGGNVHALRHLLGHTGLAMAQKYVHLLDSDIREQHSQASIVQRMFSRHRVRKVQGKESKPGQRARC